ncbi:Asp-hemolysin [Lasiodiplodia hormozganensis]|uniref:Asp-hemolysin n=1 Tax=Lasiodiplodia hormozganensis TaxID=869390 RepID=A0AA40CN75_9PEZI|nr:Asp-hemolysin [Lasiodiplodia hormozganensis]
MAYAQWVIIHIINSFRSGTISIKHAQALWGKFYKDGNKDAEISSAEVSQITIPANGTADVAACGRSDASSGTEGTIDLYEDDTKICTIYWDCPWGSKSNHFEIRDRNSAAGYMVSNSPYNADSGALGKIDVEVARKG